MYSVMNLHFYELETILRGICTMAILIFVYTRDVINDEVLGVSITLTMFYIIISFWRMYVRYGLEIVRERAMYLLSCSCCSTLIPKRNIVNRSAEADPRLTADESKEIEINQI